MDFKSIDWRKLKRLADPNAFKDLDRFIESLPAKAGYNALIAAGVVWLFAGAAILFASTQSAKVSELRTELLAVESLRPPVPEISFIPVPKASLQGFVDEVKKIELYPILTFTVSGDGKMTISGSDQDFTALTYAIGHIQGGGKNWHVALDSMCIGEECQGGTLKADLKISMVKVKEAVLPVEEKT